MKGTLYRGFSSFAACEVPASYSFIFVPMTLPRCAVLSVCLGAIVDRDVWAMAECYRCLLKMAVVDGDVEGQPSSIRSNVSSKGGTLLMANGVAHAVAEAMRPKLRGRSAYCHAGETGRKNTLIHSRPKFELFLPFRGLPNQFISNHLGANRIFNGAC
jgi:hypothetical protein